MDQKLTVLNEKARNSGLFLHYAYSIMYAVRLRLVYQI